MVTKGMEWKGRAMIHNERNYMKREGQGKEGKTNKGN
jgi:hypothetical protein